MIHQEPTSTVQTTLAVWSNPNQQPQTCVSTDWRSLLPLLSGEAITLRELKLSDAPTLLAMLSTEEVSRFVSPPPTSVEGYERFIEWTHRKRAAGELVCFGIVPHGMDAAVGLIQVRALDGSFDSAEWGFAIGSAFWGNGMFMESAEMVLDFAFGEIGIHRMEARCVVENGRGNGALEKLGAVTEMRLPKSFEKNGNFYDQFLSVILDSDWDERTHSREAAL